MIIKDKIDKFNKVLAAIYSNLMLREIDGIKNGTMKDLTFNEIHTIEFIGDLQDATVSRVANVAKVTQSTMSTMVDKLVRKGMVERNRSEDDRRVVCVKLTERGKTAYKEHENVHRQVTKRWLSALDEEEQGSLLKIMEKVATIAHK